MPYEVKHDTLCWVWTGYTDAEGTAWIRTRTGKQTTRRYYWEREHGRPVPEGMILGRLCDEPRCVRPRHFEPMTWETWHRRRGTGKLTPALAARAMVLRETLSRRETARRLGVTSPVIRAIELGTHWTQREGTTRGRRKSRAGAQR